MRRNSKESWRDVTKWTIPANKWERVIQGKQDEEDISRFLDECKALSLVDNL